MKAVSEKTYIKELNDEYHTQEHYTWKVLVCPTCEKVNVLEHILWSEADPEFVGYGWDGEEQYEPPKPTINYLYPSPKTFDNTYSDSQSIQEAYEEAVRAFKAGLYTQSVITCRKAIELLCKIHQVEEENLERSLTRMYEHRVIDEMLYEWANALRFFGNEAVHTESKFSKRDTEDIVNFTYSLIEYCIDFRLKFMALLARRKIPLARRTEVDQQIVTFIKALSDSNKFIRYYAAENLIKLDIETDKVVSVLIDLLKTESKEFLNSVEGCLVRIGQPAISELIKLIKDSSVCKQKKTPAIRALGKIDVYDTSVVSELINLFDDPNLDDSIKVVVLSSIKKIGAVAKSTFITQYEAKSILSNLTTSSSSSAS